MLPVEVRRLFAKKWSHLEYSLFLFVLYSRYRLDLKQMGLPYFTYLRLLSDLEEEDRILRKGEIPQNPTLMVSIPTMLDSSLAPPGQHILSVLVNVPYHYQEKWEEGILKNIATLKRIFRRGSSTNWNQKLIPGLRSHLLFYEAATPLTLERYTGNEMGAMYGLASTPQQVGNLRPPHQTPIRGFFRSATIPAPLTALWAQVFRVPLPPESSSKDASERRGHDIAFKTSQPHRPVVVSSHRLIRLTDCETNDTRTMQRIDL